MLIVRSTSCLLICGLFDLAARYCVTGEVLEEDEFDVVVLITGGGGGGG